MILILTGKIAESVRLASNFKSRNSSVRGDGKKLMRGEISKLSPPWRFVL
jgi:hypothetical protein